MVVNLKTFISGLAGRVMKYPEVGFHALPTPRRKYEKKKKEIKKSARERGNNCKPWTHSEGKETHGATPDFYFCVFFSVIDSRFGKCDFLESQK